MIERDFSNLQSDYLDNAPPANAAVMGSDRLECFAPLAKSSEFVHSAEELI